MAQRQTLKRTPAMQKARSAWTKASKQAQAQAQAAPSVYSHSPPDEILQTSVSGDTVQDRLNRAKMDLEYCLTVLQRQLQELG